VADDDVSVREVWGDWESTRRHKLVAGLGVSAQRRLEWLEDALRLAAATGALDRARRAKAERRDRDWNR
jgi:hypothetical protein